MKDKKRKKSDRGTEPAKTTEKPIEKMSDREMWAWLSTKVVDFEEILPFIDDEIKRATRHKPKK